MTDAKKVWMPDTFFRNEKEGRFHNILVPNVYIRIFPNGDVLYSIRYTAIYGKNVVDPSFVVQTTFFFLFDTSLHKFD
jgi:hypothetical protein